MSPRLWLVLYAALVLTASFVQAPAVLAAILAVGLAAAGRAAPRILRRAALAVLLFSGAVTIAHVWLTLAAGGDPWPWTLRTNLRALALTSASLTLVHRVPPARLAALHDGLRPVVMIALAQIAAVRRLVRDARLALRSRSPRRPGPALLVRHGGATGGALLRKAARDLTLVTRALDSRGAFLDADRG